MKFMLTFFRHNYSLLRITIKTNEKHYDKSKESVGGKNNLCILIPLILHFIQCVSHFNFATSPTNYTVEHNSTLCIYTHADKLNDSVEVPYSFYCKIAF